MNRKGDGPTPWRKWEVTVEETLSEISVFEVDADTEEEAEREGERLIDVG